MLIIMQYIKVTCDKFNGQRIYIYTFITKGKENYTTGNYALEVLLRMACAVAQVVSHWLPTAAARVQDPGK
jgi:hypothetical protein